MRSIEGRTSRRIAILRENERQQLRVLFLTQLNLGYVTGMSVEMTSYSLLVVGIGGRERAGAKTAPVSAGAAPPCSFDPWQTST